jgi:hypothetical protein
MKRKDIHIFGEMAENKYRYSNMNIRKKYMIIRANRKVYVNI